MVKGKLVMNIHFHVAFLRNAYFYGYIILHTYRSYGTLYKESQSEDKFSNLGIHSEGLKQTLIHKICIGLE